MFVNTNTGVKNYKFIRSRIGNNVNPGVVPFL